MGHLTASLKKIYRTLPIAPGTRAQIRGVKHKIKKMLPYRFQEKNPALRKYGTVQDLCFWRIDQGIDTVLLIQNFYSIYYPHLNTKTRVSIRCYDSRGEILCQNTYPLETRETKRISVRDLLSSVPLSESYGTLMWHIALPEEVASQKECADNHAYFTDRGYISYEKLNSQACFVHGIDRYAVFQKTDFDEFSHYYSPSSSFSWNGEIPISIELGCEKLDVLTINRTSKHAEISLDLLDNASNTIQSWNENVAPRGAFLKSIEKDVIESFAAPGSIRIRGVPTEWSRMIIMRHFQGDAISVMHC